MADFRNHLITGMGTMLLTGFISWLTFGQGVMTHVDHKQPAAHDQQNVWNMNIEMRVKALEKVQDRQAEKVAQRVVEILQRDE